MATQTNSSMLGMNIAKDQIECVLYHGGHFKSTTVDNSARGFSDLVDWLNKHDVHRVHAFCDEAAQSWQEAAHFLSHVGHRVSVLNEAQIRACAAALARSRAC
ncbi:MAG: IS110 family transposase [Noviherbaspirillum sp.]